MGRLTGRSSDSAFSHAEDVLHLDPIGALDQPLRSLVLPTIPTRASSRDHRRHVPANVPPPEDIVVMWHTPGASTVAFR